MFIVIMKGVYQQGIWGVRNTLEEAKELARKRLEAEPDDYHCAEISTMNEKDEEILIGRYTRNDNKKWKDFGSFEYGEREYKWIPAGSK